MLNVITFNTFHTSLAALVCRGGSRGRVQGVRTPPPEMSCGILIQLVFCQTMWFIGVEVEQEKSAPPPKKNTGSAPGLGPKTIITITWKVLHVKPTCSLPKQLTPHVIFMFGVSRSYVLLWMSVNSFINYELWGTQRFLVEKQGLPKMC